MTLSHTKTLLEVLEKYNLVDDKTANKLKECNKNKNSHITDNDKASQLRSAGQLKAESRLIQTSPLQDTTKKVVNTYAKSDVKLDLKKERTAESCNSPIKTNISKKCISHFSSV